MKRIKPTGRVFTIADASKGPPLATVAQPPIIRASSDPRYGYAHRSAQRGTSQAFVYDHARVFGTGNPRSTGATGGESIIVKRRNVSTYTRFN